MVNEPDEIVMNNDPSEVSGPPATEQNGIEHTEADAAVEASAEASQPPPVAAAKERSKVNSQVDAAAEDGRSDSEAETVVMPGKEEGSSNGPKRAIKHEGGTRGKAQSKGSRDDRLETSKDRSRAADDKPKKPSVLTATNNSSNLSSARSSPGHEQEHRPASRANSESATAKAKPSHDSDAQSRGSVSRKRKISGDEAEEKSHRRRVKRERRSEERSLTEPRKVGQPRQDSPSRQRPRALSTQSSNPGSTQKRKKPPPLLVGSKRKASDESDSNDSTRERVSSAHPKRSAALEDSAMPRTHRKLRDKNGRTILARACAAEDVESVVARLEERPEDLDEEDNAGNTPLQIAALEGNVDIVKVLLQHGCKIDCMNTDKDTPLIDAVENGHFEVVKLLLKAGVNPRQVNAKGEEPIDLVDLEGDNGKDIKAILERAKGRYDRRRESEDTKIPNTGKESLAGRSPRESPSLHTARSPPPPTSRRRPARGEPSRNDLLWLNPTPERLREKAGMGDDQAVLHILEMKPMADPEAVLAAAKGGHETSLSFLFAIGKANPDPEPLRTFKDGLNTPMLVAIGRSNVGVLKLVLDQPGFDPTRRVYKKLLYHDLAKERRGVGWEEEYRLLKSAYDRHRERNGAKSPVAHRSPQSREGKKALREKASTSPLREGQKIASPTLTAKDPLGRKKAIIEGKGVSLRRDRDKEGSDRAENTRRHLKVPKRDSREGSTAISDREASPLTSVNGHKKRSMSDAEKDAPKPRKRLVSGRDLRNDQERKRRNSLISMASTSSAQEHVRTNSGRDPLSVKSKRDEKAEAKVDAATAKKRARRSDTPPERRTVGSPMQSELKKPKRPRVNSDSKVQDKSSKTSASSGPARVAKMGTATSSSGSAPVAFMGGSSAAQIKDTKLSPPELSPVASGKDKLPSTKSSPTEGKPAATEEGPETTQTQAANPQPKIKEEDPTEELASRTDHPLTMESADAAVSKATEDGRTSQEAQASTEKASSIDPSQTKLDKEEAERLQRERDEAAQLKQKQDEEEALRRKEQQEAEAEAAALQKRKEEAEAAAAEEAARLKRQKEIEEEITRRKKLAEEEEAARRKRKLQEEEEIARLKKKREEDLERQRLRRQEEEERQRRDKLPEGLRWAAALDPDARASKEALWWLPLMSVKGSQLDPDCVKQLQDELWVSNIQVAPLLGLADLDLSQCKYMLQEQQTG